MTITVYMLRTVRNEFERKYKLIIGLSNLKKTNYTN